ncbi:hypothetical protein ACSMXN_06645 [Jatrophihabitans sp. DSM 45814]
MSIPIDEVTYGDDNKHDPDEIRQGNPGRSQSEFESADPDDGASETLKDPTDTEHATGEDQAQKNAENEPPG